jgi:hypothetical protein
MTTIAGIFAGTGPITFAAPESARARLSSGSSSASTSSASHYADLATIHRRVAELGRALDEAQSVFEALRMGTQAAGRGEAVSASALSIDPTPRHSTLESTEEVNTVPTSYSPFGPSWTGSSTTLPTIGGTYDGSGGDDTLRFRVTSRTRTVGGSRDINIRVYDQGGTKTLENIVHRAGTPPGTPISLSNGLTLTLGAGDAERDDEFFLNVSTTVDSEIDPDLAFDGTRNDNPNLEPGLPITAGSFTVNGELITVAADDTVTTVLDRINASAAGVTAVYDPATELVSFERDDSGELDITLGGDSSGFLDSMKLSGATVVLGNENGEQGLAMAEVDALSATVAGSITINDVEIAIDPDSDSLLDVVDAINASEAGVTASFDTDSLRVTIASDSASGAVVLEDSGTNFLTQVEIDPGTYQGRRSTQISKIMARKAQRALGNVAEALDKLRATELSDSRAQTALGNAVSSIEGAITSALGDHEELLSDAGLSFDPDAEDGEALLDLTSTLFERALRSSDGADLKSAMVGSMLDRDDGLLGMMGAAVDDLETTLRRSTSDVGVYLSTYA